MKKLLILILLLLMSLTCYSQDNLYLSLKFDPNMAIFGLGEEHGQGNIKAFNWEIEAGYELESIRFGMAYEELHQIDYKKWTFVKVDYVLRDYLLWIEVDNFTQYTGIEGSNIYRYQPNDWKNRDSSYSFGFNAEIQYDIWYWFAVGVQTNVFYAEKLLIDDGKYVRWDSMIGIIYKIK